MNQIKFWFFHYKMTTAVCQILRTFLFRKEKRPSHNRVDQRNKTGVE